MAVLNSNGGLYFEKSARVIAFCKARGIRQSFSPPDTPNLNAVAERGIRTVCEMTRSNMIAANAPASMWGEAVVYAVYILNNLPFVAGADATRNNRFCGQEPTSQPPSRIKKWGCAAYVQITGH